MYLCVQLSKTLIDSRANPLASTPPVRRLTTPSTSFRSLSCKPITLDFPFARPLSILPMAGRSAPEVTSEELLEVLRGTKPAPRGEGREGKRLRPVGGDRARGRGCGWEEEGNGAEMARAMEEGEMSWAIVE
jgi:hypothetical protein